ncbi:hypothetical protein R6Q57_000784 [Mikania cordata]
MDSVATTEKKPHVILIPLPAQSHIKAMLKLAEVLHHKGLQITFVNTEYTHKRLVSSGGDHCLDGSPGFRFETIPDGIPRKSEDDDGSKLLLQHVETTFLTPFLDLATKLPTPPTSQKLGIPAMLYWTFSACGFMGLYHINSLVVKGLSPLKGESVVMPLEFEEHVKNRGFIASWCPQEKVLNHPLVGGFLTHCGWGSTIESLSAGVPMICWSYLWDQLTNCRYICKEWEVGLEMGNKVNRDEVKRLVDELMGDEGDQKRIKAKEWLEKAQVATAHNGSSSLNVNELVNEILMPSRNQTRVNLWGRVFSGVSITGGEGFQWGDDVAGNFSGKWFSVG